MARRSISGRLFPFVFAGIMVSLVITMGLVWVRVMPAPVVRVPVVAITVSKTHHRHHHHQSQMQPDSQPEVSMTDAVPVVPHHYNHFHKLRLLNRKRHKTVIIGPESWRRPGHWLMNLPAPTDFNFKASLMQHGGKLVVDKSKGMRKSKGVHFQEPLSIFNKYQDLSENPDWRVRGKWQQRQVSSFCQKHNLFDSNITLPARSVDRDIFMRRMLYDDHHKVVFCFIPKVGCTNMKISILVGQRKLSRIVLRLLKRKPDLVELKVARALRKASFVNANLTDSDLIERIKDYRKFVIFRHPLGRLVSAYRDKLGTPLLKTKWQYNYFEELKHAIVLKYHPNAYHVWKTTDIQQNLYVPFATFVRWLVNSQEHDLNEYFQTQLIISRPCLMQYDFYGDFRTFGEDALQVLHQFTSDVSAFRKDGYHHGMQTHQLLHLYYSQLQLKLKRALWRHWKLEFELYHLLYPNELALTERLLGTSPDVR